MIAGSSCALVAIESDRVVGFARAIGDGVSNGYISTVVVDKEFRRRGIGRRMVQHLIGADPAITWVLRAGRDSTRFWQSLGFTHSTIAMERVRRAPVNGSQPG